MEISFDRGIWEVDAYKQKLKHELEVDPVTGAIKKDKLDDWKNSGKDKQHSH